MPYCQNCGTKLPDNAKFCIECGTAAQAQQPSPEPKTRRSTTGIVIALAAVALVLLIVVAVLLTLHISARRSAVAPGLETVYPSHETTSPAQKMSESFAEPTDAPDEPADEDERGPLNAAQNGDNEDLRALLSAYEAVTDTILDATSNDFAAECNRGRLYDYDSDGWPELVLLYSLDGDSLHSVIVRRTDDSANPVCMEQDLWAVMAGGAAGAIYSGTLDTGESVIFLEETSWEAETQVGKDYVYSLADADIELLYQLEWYADIDGDIINCWVFDENGELMSRDNLEQFLNIFNARETCDATYPSDQHGVLLADLFSDEAMEDYYA